MNKNKRIAVGLVFVILVVGLLFVGIRFRPFTVLSVSNIQIEPQGYEDAVTKEWRGSFWTVLMTTSCTENVEAYQFDKSVSGTYNRDTITLANGTTRKLVPQSSIVIKVDPDRPYWERPLEIKSVLVTPKTYGTWQNKINAFAMGKTTISVSELDSEHYEWGAGSWTLHTPFTVSVLKNGVQIGEQYVDTVGSEQTIRLPSSGDEYVTLTNLGKIGTGYGEPQLGDILYFSDDQVFEASSRARELIAYDGGSLGKNDDSFSVYWYGTYQESECKSMRWEDGSPKAAKSMEGIIAPCMLTSNRYGGWYDADNTLNWIRNPLQPPRLVGDIRKTGGFMSLVEYLMYKGVPKKNLNVWNQGFEVIDNKMKIYLPYSSMNSLITVRISTELADTIVWRPQVGNFQITEFPDIGEVPDRKTGYIVIKQLSDIVASGTVTFSVSPSGLLMSINPMSLGTGGMGKDFEVILPFEVVNLGAPTRQDFTVTAVVTNSLGSETDRDTSLGTLLPKGGGVTTLTVYTIDKKTRSYVSGIQFTVVWEGGSLVGITSGGSWSHDFGAVHPTVTVTTAETATYYSASASKALAVGPNSITLELIRQGEIPPTNWTLIIIIVVVLIAVIVIAVAASRRKKK